MKGTQKQIDWATDIKAKRMADLINLEALPIPTGHPAAKALKVVRDRYESTDAEHAGWWIAVHQNMLTTEYLANEIAQGKGPHRWPTETNCGWE
jgi:hypothetical protein